MRSLRALGWILVAVATVAACGKKGPPLPPEPRGPQTPATVTVRQIGAHPTVAFRLPATRGAKPAQEMIRVELIRVRYMTDSPPPPDADAFRRRGERVHVELADLFTPGDVLALEDDSVTELDEGGVGATLRYAVRVLDRRGRPSTWVAAPDLILLPPGSPPAALAAEPTAAGVRLTWSGDAAAGYNLYRSDADSGAPVPVNDQPIRDPEYLDEEVTMGSRYTYFVRALLADGRPRRESADSAPATITAIDRFPPGRPEGLVAVQEGVAVRLFWDPNPERDVQGYRVSRSVDDGPFVPLGADVLVRPLHLDDDVRPGQRLRYRVTAVDGAEPPNESAAAETEPLIVVDEPVSGSGDSP